MWSGWIQRTQTWTIICHGLHYWLTTPGANGKFNFGNLALSTNGLFALGLSAILAPFCDTLRLTDGFRAVLLGTVIGCFPNMKDLSCWLSKNGWFQWWKGWWMETELMSFVVIFFLHDRNWKMWHHTVKHRSVVVFCPYLPNGHQSALECKLGRTPGPLPCSPGTSASCWWWLSLSGSLRCEIRSNNCLRSSRQNNCA